MEDRLALWSDLSSEDYGFELLDQAARQKELRRFVASEEQSKL